MPHEYRQYYRRKLPHRHSPNTILFVTFRLFGSIPKPVLREWKSKRDFLLSKQSKGGNSSELSEFHREWFVRFESLLDRAETGPTWLKDERVARLVYDSILYRTGAEYDLSAFTVMSNHAHVVFKPFVDERSLTEIRADGRLRFDSDHPTMDVIMKSLKGYTARRANQILNRSGQFWDSESYDHEVRNEAEFRRIIEYVQNNPVKAGIVKEWREYPWTWVKDSLRD